MGQSYRSHWWQWWRRWWWGWWRTKMRTSVRVCACVLWKLAFFCKWTSLKVYMNAQPSVCMTYVRPSWTSLHPHTPLLPLVLPILCKWKFKAIFGESWCHKWFERWAYNCWSRFVWQSDKPWTAPVTDWDLLATTTEGKYSASIKLLVCLFLTGPVGLLCVWAATGNEQPFSLYSYSFLIGLKQYLTTSLPITHIVHIF